MICLKKLLAVVATSVAATSVVHADATLLLDPSATYLETSEYTGWGVPHSSFAYSLASLGFSAGDTVTFTRVGAYQSTYVEWGGTDTSTGLLGVFSSSSTLLGPINPGADANTLLITPAVRVPGAIATTLPAIVSKPIYHGLTPDAPLNSVSTDIVQDFAIGKSGTTVVIPTGAQYIFFSANDNLFGDNTDPNSDFGVMITAAAVPEPSSVLMMLSGVMALAGIAVRRRKV
jgi:hypothetical protein